jgi:protocatechuate 3,4-dioxygenase, alpha subunit
MTEERGAGREPPGGVTPAQTAGPFLHIGMAEAPWPDGPDVVPPGNPGAILISGTVRDGNGDPVPDALVETWQSDAAGRFEHPDDPRGPAPSEPHGFRGFGRAATNETGRYQIRTVKPGPLPAPEGGQEAPHIDVSVFARGLLDRLVTRIYFPDEEQTNAADPLLRSIDDVARRRTLVAVPDGDGLRFDIWLQGEHETVFLAV